MSMLLPEVWHLHLQFNSNWSHTLKVVCSLDWTIFSTNFRPALKAAFKTARFFSPSKITDLKASAAEVDSLFAFPFLSSTQDLVGLKGELATYLVSAEGVDPTIDCLELWKQHATLLPAWAAAAKKVLVAQPSSAAAECFSTELHVWRQTGQFHKRLY